MAEQGRTTVQRAADSVAQLRKHGVAAKTEAVAQEAKSSGR
jgi:hypothetical protein